MASPARRSSYRHGDLSGALLAAGIDLARGGGPGAVVLREATRRAGVSPNAAYRHYADHRALLGAVCAAAMSQLAVAMEAELAAVPAGGPAQTARARFRAVGAGYLRYAQDEPGLFRTAFAGVDPSGDAAPPAAVPAAHGASGLTPFELLGVALDDLVAVGLLAPGRRPDAAHVAWSAVHGLAMLVIDGPLQELGTDRRAEVGRALLDMVERGLLGQPAAGAEPVTGG